MHLLVDFIQLLLQQLRIGYIRSSKVQNIHLLVRRKFLLKKKPLIRLKKNKSMLDNEFNLTFN